jgi:hypothetical protein
MNSSGYHVSIIYLSSRAFINLIREVRGIYEPFTYEHAIHMVIDFNYDSLQPTTTLEMDGVLPRVWMARLVGWSSSQ